MRGLPASEQASANVATVVVGTQQMSASIAEIGRQVAHSTEVVANTVSSASRLSACMTRLGVTADQIGEAIQLIQRIASQTKLLALNATIESARAGSAANCPMVVR